MSGHRENRNLRSKAAGGANAAFPTPRDLQKNLNVFKRVLNEIKRCLMDAVPILPARRVAT